MKWPSLIEGVLFAYPKYSCTRYSPFKLQYNRQPVLPIDVKYKLSTENWDPDEPFDKDIFDVLASSDVIREEAYTGWWKHKKGPNK